MNDFEYSSIKQRFMSTRSAFDESMIEPCKNDIRFFAEQCCMITDTDDFVEHRSLIKLSNSQKELLKKFKTNGKLVIYGKRQSGKTSLCCIYALWNVLLFPNRKVLIVTHPKKSTAMHTMDIISRIYEDLPSILKQIVLSITDERVEFSNGSCLEVVPFYKNDVNLKEFDVIMFDECAFLNDDQTDELKLIISELNDFRQQVILISSYKKDGDSFFEELYENSPKALESNFVSCELNRISVEKLLTKSVSVV